MSDECGAAGWRDWPEWQAVQAAVGTLVARINAEHPSDESAEHQMVSDMALVVATIPVTEDYFGGYHVYAQSREPHVIEGLFRQGIDYAKSCSPHGWEA